jgi:DNA invertase Pin-like site-specific DNA recombinase
MLERQMMALHSTGARPMTSNGKFVAYYRVSTERQGRSGLGLEAQRAAVASYLNGGNWSIAAEFTEVESGRKADRPELDKALAAARLHRCPLVVSKVDRLTRSVAFLSRLLEANVDMRFADLPQIEGATGRFLLQQMASVAELEAGMISARTRAALGAAKARGKKLGGRRIRKSDGMPVVISRAAQKRGAAANRMRAADRAADLAPMIAQIREGGAVTLAAIAEGLNNAGIPTPRGQGVWMPMQVRRTLQALSEAQGPVA